MTSGNVGVLDTNSVQQGDSPQGRQRSSRVETMQQDQRTQALALNKQNDFFFNVLKIKAVNEKDNFVRRTKDKYDNDKKLKRYQEQQSKAFVDVKEAATQEPLYADALVQLRTAITELRLSLPATAPLIEELVQYQKDAAAIVPESLAKAFREGKTAPSEAPKFKEAIAALNLPAVKKALERGPEVAANAIKKGRVEAPEAFKLQDKLLKVLETAPLGLDSVEEFKAAIHDEMFLLRQSDNNVSGFEANRVTNLGEIEKRINKAISDAQGPKAAFGGLQQEVDAAINKLETYIGAGVPNFDEGVVAELRRMVTNAKSAREMNQHAQAQDILNTAKTECANWSRQASIEFNDANQRWQAAAQEITTGQQRCQGLVSGGSVPPPLVKELQALLNQFNDLAARKPTTLQTLKPALADFERAKTALATTAPRVSGAASFNPKTAAQPIEDQIKGTETSLGKLVTRLQGEAMEDSLRTSVTGPFTQRLEQVKSDFAQRKSTAFDLTSLGADEFVTRLNTLEAEIIAATQDGAVAALKLSPALNQARDALQTAIEDAERLARKLVGANPEMGLKMNALCVTARQALVGGDSAALLNAARETLTKSLSGYAQIAKRADGRITDLREKIDQACADVPGQLDKMKLEVEKKRGGNDRKGYEAMLGTLHRDYDLITAARDCDHVDVLTKVLKDALNLKRDAADMLLAVQDNPGKDTWTLKKASELFNYLVSLLKKEEVGKEYMVVTYSGLEDRLETAKKELGSTNVLAQKKELTAINDAITKLHEDAATAKANYQAPGGLKDICAAIEKRLNDSDVKGSAPDYVKSVLGQVKSLLSNGKFEGGLKAALDQARALQIEVDTHLTSTPNAVGVPVLVAEKQTKEEEDQRKKELDKSKWEGEIKVAKAQVENVKTFNVKEAEGLTKMLEDTVKGVEKSNDYAYGRSQLVAINRRIAAIQTNPRGLAIASRNKLPLVNALFRKAVVDYGKALKQVENGVAASALDDAGKTEIKRRLAELRTFFNPAAFKKTVDIMFDMEKNDEKTRSAAREVGLREARRMMAYLQNDYRLRALSDTPFNKAMGAELSKLNLALLNVENNMLVSL